MRPDILIIGQGLAGTTLAWALERAGIGFDIVDRGHACAATWAAAGIVNPITGRRLVKSWRIDACLPAARAMYQEIECELGLGEPLWQEMRIWRSFADEGERATFARKQATGQLAPFAEPAPGNDTGFWVRPGARVDLRTLLSASRDRWQAAGRLRGDAVAEEYGLVIDCTGTAILDVEAFSFVPWEVSKGEILELRTGAGTGGQVESESEGGGGGLAPDVILNRRRWIAPVAPDAAWLGATHEPGVTDLGTTAAAAESLLADARAMLGDGFKFAVNGQRAGVRVNLPDKRPVAGRHPAMPRLGIVNGLGAKGVLWAPMLAKAWVEHLRTGAAFDAEFDVRRFGP